MSAYQAHPHRPQYVPATTVQVTKRDTRGFGNNWLVGTHIVLQRYDESDDSWRAAIDDDDDQYGQWIGQEDIGSIEDEAALEREAFQLFGLEPTAHCKTCTCHD